MSTETLKNTTAGGWTLYKSLTKEDQKVFEEAFKGFVGVKYTPESVSTQIVAGTNYRFKCNATLPGPDSIQWEAIVEIFQPLGDEKPHITGITKL